ncbi:MAG: hydantoinase/oxoprolinase family protein [Acidobacteriaceae bacterium]|nr:hydantoinase/oxoprolinase family protein [Acidobacteriaceae bacterium]
MAVDTGGTFTDCAYWSGDELAVLKLPSTAAHPERAVLEAIRNIATAHTSEVRHGTTVGTNTLLERKGARVAFVTTEGLEDTIEIGRQARGKLYDWFWMKEPPLVPEQMRFGVPERIASDGSVVRALDSAALVRLKEQVAARQPEAIAVSLLFSFANPEHERAVVAALEDLQIPVSASIELLPEFREYERGSTVLINAYLTPGVRGYLERLDSSLRIQGLRLSIMQSSGGILPAAVAAREPVRTILSGPAGGVVGAVAVGRPAGFSRILSFDMGGTSTDVALMDADAGRRTTTESQILGMPVAVPMLDIHTVGAGGGSLASFDRAGALRVGPQSAGADPGPICYGNGEQPTVTDANLVLGRLDAEHFLSGGMRLDEQRARDFLERAKGSLPTVEAFAEGVIRVADAHMERALRRISIQRGYDPREFVLLSFGGAGPLHACALARALRIRNVLTPRHPGALSAYGILVSDVVRDYSRTVMLAPCDPAIERHFAALENAGNEDMAEHGLRATPVRSIDMRYAGQGYELNVEWSTNFVSEFHRLHEQRYGYADVERPVEIVNARIRMIAMTPSVAQKRSAFRDGDGKCAVIKHKQVYVDGEWREARVYGRARLCAGDRLAGPAVVVEYSATTFVPPGSRARVDEYENLILDVRGE